MLDETFVNPVGDPNPCPFEVTYRNQGTFFVTTFVDANGNTIRELDRGACFLESYSANGKVISSKSPAMIHVDPATNTAVGTGNQRHFIVPGLGIVYAQADAVSAVTLRETTDENRQAILALRAEPNQERLAGTVAGALRDARDIPEGKPWYRRQN
jgi:hypothetical protein